MSDLRGVVTEADWNVFVEAIADGKVSIMEVIKHNRPEAGDYLSHVQSSRAFTMLLGDERIIRRLYDEIYDVMIAAGDKSPDRHKAAPYSKDAVRRFSKMVNIRNEIIEGSPSLLSGATFKECLAQYLNINAYLEQIWTDSTDFYRRGRYPLATYTALLLLEEMGKIGHLWQELLSYDSPRRQTKDWNRASRDHRQKAFIAVVAGALVNARLDRILGLKVVRQILQDAESGALEKVRQSCLYVDFVDGALKMPTERIDTQKAKTFVVLAGEIWAETYGHFPFEYDRMIELVTTFEVELGYSPEQICGRP